MISPCYYKQVRDLASLDATHKSLLNLQNSELAPPNQRKRWPISGPSDHGKLHAKTFKELLENTKHV